jgi:hypothetical protein
LLLMKLLRPQFLIALLLLLVASRGPLRAQSFAWAKVAGGTTDTASVRAKDSATDAAGNTYIIVNFANSIQIGTIQVTGPALGALAIAKYDLTGRVEWAKALVNISNPKLAADNAAGGVFVVAANQGGGTWGGAAVPTAAGANFYAKCSADGVLQWSNSLPVLCERNRENCQRRGRHARRPISKLRVQNRRQWRHTMGASSARHFINRAFQTI